MSRFDRPNPAVAMGRDAKPARMTADAEDWPWFVGFEHILSISDLTIIGGWISENIPSGCRFLQPKWYYFATEEDALLTFMRFR